MAVYVQGQELTLSGTVGADWFDDGFTHAQVVMALASLDGDITVRLNSGGGYAAEGAAIHATLKSYSGNVDLVVDGIAASAASLIAMAGDTITMSDGAVLMIHDPMNVTIGNSDDHAKTIEELEAYAVAYARIYAARSGKSVDECRSIMKAETWFAGEEAVAAGFADSTGDTKAHTAAAYDYRVYAKAPKRLVAQAKAKGWSIAKHIKPDAAEVSAATTANDRETETMAKTIEEMQAELDKANAELANAAAAANEAVKADRERRAAIMALDEAKGREGLAEALFTDGATVERAKALLSAAPAPHNGADQVNSENFDAAKLSGANIAGGRKPDAKASWATSVAKMNKRLAN